MDGMLSPKYGFKLLSGTANRPLAEEIARSLGVELCKVTTSRFADGEIFVRIDENIRGSDIFIVQPTNAPADNVMELLLLIDAARRASAARITCVMPYYGYSRQDRKDQPRVAIGAKLVANLIEVAGADRVLGIDFHQHQLQGFFDVPVDLDDLSTAEVQDVMAWTTQGAIADRTAEHLGSSDRGVTLLRRMLMRELKKIEAGEDPMLVNRDPAKDVPLDLPLETDKAHFTDGFAVLLSRRHWRYAGINDELLAIFAPKPQHA